MRIPWIVKWALASDPIAAFDIWVQEISYLAILVDEKTISTYAKDVDAALKKLPWGAIARVILFWQRWHYWRKINQEPF